MTPLIGHGRWVTVLAGAAIQAGCNLAVAPDSAVGPDSIELRPQQFDIDYSITVKDLLPGTCLVADFINNSGQVVIRSCFSGHAFLWDASAITDLGTLGGSETLPLGLNQLGQIVGHSRITPGSIDFHAFFWDAGTMTDLGTLFPSGCSSDAYAINDNSQVLLKPVGASCAGAPSLLLWDAGTVTQISPDVSGSPTIGAIAMNNAGQLVGQGYFGGYPRPPQAALWQDGILTDLGILWENGTEGSFALDINESGKIVGWGHSGPESTCALLWDRGTVTCLGVLGGSGSEAYYINDLGQVAGVSTTDVPQTHPFFWDQGTMTDVGTFGGVNSRVTGLNNRGQVVGWMQMGLTAYKHAFFWDRTCGLIDLGTLGGDVSSANDINDAGDVVGSAQTTTGEYHPVLWHVMCTQTPIQQTAALIDEVQQLANTSVLDADQAGGLLDKLDETVAKLQAGNIIGASNQLGAFVNQVKGFVDAGPLTSEQGQPLIDKAQSIRATLAG